MKMRGSKQVHYDSGPNMTPLVDVVMVILIFLMLAGSFGGGTQFLLSKQSIKQAGGGGDYKRDPNKPIEVPIDIRVDNASHGDGFVAQGTGLSPTNSPEQLVGILRKKRSELMAAGNTKDQIQVVLYPGRQVKYRYLVSVYQAALQAEVEKIAFATSH